MTRARRRLAFSATEAYAAGSGHDLVAAARGRARRVAAAGHASTMRRANAPPPLPPGRAAPPAVVASGARRPVGQPARQRPSSPRGARAAPAASAVHRALEWAAGAAGVTGLDRALGGRRARVRRRCGRGARHAAAILAMPARPLLPRRRSPLERQRGAGQRRPARCCASTGWCGSRRRAASRSGGCSTTSCSHAPRRSSRTGSSCCATATQCARAQPGQAVRCAFIAGDGRGGRGSP